MVTTLVSESSSPKNKGPRRVQPVTLNQGDSTEVKKKTESTGQEDLQEKPEKVGFVGGFYLAR